MKYISRTRSLVWFLSLASFFSLQAKKIGSDAMVTLFKDPQIAGNADEVAAFAALNGGLMVSDSNAQVKYNSLFPIAGSLDLRGGELILGSNLVLSGMRDVIGIGSIDGQGFALEFPASLEVISNNQPSGKAQFITKVVDTVSLNTCDWSLDDTILAVGSNSSISNALDIYSFNGADLIFKNGLGSLQTINVVQWQPGSYLLAVGKQGFGVSETLSIYLVDQETGAFTPTSSLLFNSIRDVVALSWHPSGNWLAVAQGAQGRQIAIYFVDSSGVIAPTPVASVTLARSIQKRALAWNATGDFLAVGIAQQGNSDDLFVYSFNQTAFNLTFDSSVELGRSVLSVAWNNAYPDVLAVGLDGINGALLRVYEKIGSTLVERTTVFGIDAPVRAVSWSHNGQSLAIGTAQKSAADFVTYTFDRDSFTLTQVSDFDVKNNVNALQFSHNDQFIALVTDRILGVNPSGGDLAIYSSDAAYFNPVPEHVFKDLSITLNNDLLIDNCSIVFEGNCTINGNGYALTIGPSCNLSVANNSRLTLNNLYLNNVNGTNLKNLSATSKIVMQDVEMIMTGDYHFTTGSLQFYKTVKIVGLNTTFAYKSDQVSKILQNSQLILDAGLTLSYDPAIEDQHLIQFTDYTSSLILNGAHLHVTATGLMLTIGNFVVNSDSFLSADFIDEASSGITFGNGNAIEDLFVSILQAASVHLLENTILRYRNIQEAVWHMPHLSSQLIMHGNSKLYLYEFLNLENGTLRTLAPVTVGRAPGKQLIGKINSSLGAITFVAL